MQLRLLRIQWLVPWTLLKGQTWRIVIPEVLTLDNEVFLSGLRQRVPYESLGVETVDVGLLDGSFKVRDSKLFSPSNCE
jgi:hypothetical protein